MSHKKHSDSRTSGTVSSSQTRSESPSSIIKEQIERQRHDGYTVMPSQLLAGTSLYNQLYLHDDIINFCSLSPKASPYAVALQDGGDCACGGNDASRTHAASFISGGSEVAEPNCGDPELGWIQWGSNNMLPNFISLANLLLPYTAEAIEFNTKVAVGLGLTPIYNHPAITNDDGQPLPYQAAGSRIKDRILTLQKQLYELVHSHQSSSSAFEAGAPDPTATVSEDSPSASTVPFSHARHESVPYLSIHDIISPSAPALDDDDDSPSGTPSSSGSSAFNAAAPSTPIASRPSDFFSRIADDILEDTIRQTYEEIDSLKKDYGIWQKTKTRLDEFLAKSDTLSIMQPAAADRVSFGLCYHTINLNIANRKERMINGQWRPRIVSIGHLPAQKCRKERNDASGVSRHVYISNAWLNPQEFTSEHDVTITALPSIDPQHPREDLETRIEKFRIDEQIKHDAAQEEAGDQPVFDDINLRPTRFVLATGQYTPGRTYYPVPAYWSIYNDVYQYASTIIRDRAIRKANENMFGRIVYVHSEYLEKLSDQLDAQHTEEERLAIKEKEIKKIQDFLSSKFNNGSTFATCSFIGADGQTHDAFRVETIPYNNTSEASANRTEIQDISGIILFVCECHPDLIGATPGASSSSGGTYQREMMLIKQSLIAPVQHSILAPYRLARDFNHWDPRLDFTIEQRTLTSLDQKHSGWENARK